mmetsp:Transcript_87021/g.182143  ORF Transcript_87021/g.182143 Transcript_87021/m.182143 type:complete len:424 (-) Transcript_87021:137-1408(-)
MSSLDMALDDMIKKGGNRKAAGGNKSGNAGPRKLRAPKEDEGDKGQQKERVQFAKGVASGILRSVSSAAKAAAKATATEKTPSALGKSGVAAVSTAAPISSGGRVTAPQNTADKLGMTLDDICKTSNKRTAKVAKGAPIAKGGLKGLKNLKYQMTLVRGMRGKVKAKSMARTSRMSSMAKGKGGGKGLGKGGKSGKGKWPPIYDKFDFTAPWTRAPPGMPKGKGKGFLKGFFGKGLSKGGRRFGAEDDWGFGGPSRPSFLDDDREMMPPMKRMRPEWDEPPRTARRMGMSDLGPAGRVLGALPLRREAPRREAPRRAAAGDGWERIGDRERVSGRRVVEEAAPVRAAAATRSEGVRIKVTNVPLDLDRREIKEAFGERGRVLKCEVDRGVAYVTFERASEAKKAMQTFDRGELNGQTIYVSLD